MIMTHYKYFIVYLLVGLLTSCSYSDLTDLWPSGNDVEEEIVIREIPNESFDPEDTEEITITEIEESDEVTEIDILSNEEDNNDLNEENLDNLLTQDNTDDSENNIQTTNNGKVDPIFTYVGQRILEMQEEFNKLDADIRQGEDNFEELKGKNFGYSCCQELNSVKDFEQQISRVLRQGSEGVPFLLNDDMRISFAAGPILEKLEHLYLDITSNFQDDNFRSQSAVSGRKDFKASLSEFLSKIQSDVLEYKYKLIRSHREVDKLNSLLSHCNEKSSQQSKTINDYEIQISDLKKTLAICKKDLNSEKSRGFLLETRLRKKSNNTKNLKKKLHAYSNLIDSSIEFSKAQSNQLEGQDSDIQHKSDTIIRLKNQSKNLHSQISELKESYLQMSSKYSTLRRVIPDVMISLFKFLDSHSNKLKPK